MHSRADQKWCQWVSIVPIDLVVRDKHIEKK